MQALQDAKPDAIFSSLFGADLARFVREGEVRGLFNNRPVFNLLGGEPEYLDPLKDEAPVGWWVTGYPWSEIHTAEHKRFRDAYQKKFDSPPSYASYVMSQAILGLKAAAEKAMAKNPKPSGEDIVTALEKLEFEAPSGTVKMSLAKGHQAVQENAIGRFKLQGGKATIVDVKRYPPECVNPPEGTTAAKWIEAGFPGAKC